MYEPEIAGRIISACVMLHSMRLHYRIPFQEIAEEDFAQADAMPAPGPYVADPLEGRARLAEGRRIQQQLIRDNFMHL